MEIFSQGAVLNETLVTVIEQCREAKTKLKSAWSATKDRDNPVK